MKVTDAIIAADALRPNTLSDAQKVKWLWEVEGEVAEMMGVECPDLTFPITEQELLLPPQHEGVYSYYLAAMADYHNGESDLYANDMALYNQAMNEAKAHYRRTHTPSDEMGWKVM